MFLPLRKLHLIRKQQGVYSVPKDAGEADL